MLITASIVAHHTKQDDLNRLIDCVMRSPIEVLYIVDNSSHDALRQKVADNAKIRYIHSLNLGYGAGHNIALRLAMEVGARYHAVLNPDVYWTDKVIEELIEFMEQHKDFGLVMPRILYPDGSIQQLCKLLPTPMDLFVRRFIPVASLRKRLDHHYEMQWADYDRTMEVPSLSGCFMFMRCSVLQQIGLFDERFFMYAEDLDLCRRIGEVSKTMYHPVVSVYHEYAKGSYKNKKLLKYHMHSVIRYFNKWGWFFDTKRRQKNNACKNMIINRL
ncbi:MAG: glycosyltransferase family 2 protein [Alistipes sp.]|nr:glycosyltransferase family 2 protein [Alistipes sp.]